MVDSQNRFKKKKNLNVFIYNCIKRAITVIHTRFDLSAACRFLLVIKKNVLLWILQKKKKKKVVFFYHFILIGHGIKIVRTVTSIIFNLYAFISSLNERLRDYIEIRPVDKFNIEKYFHRRRRY